MPTAKRISASTNIDNIPFQEQGAAPLTPAAGYQRLYFTTAGPAWVDSTGTVRSFAAPPAIGSTTPNTGAFTTLSASSTVTLSGAVTVNPASENALTISRASGSAGLNLSAAAGNYRSIRLQTAGSLRWVLEANNTAEGGANAGSDFNLSRWDDTGVFLNLVWEITRSNGNFRIVNDLEVDGALNHDGSTVGFYGATPVARPTYGAPTGVATRTTFATGSVTLPQLAERVKAIIDDLRLRGDFA